MPDLVIVAGGSGQHASVVYEAAVLAGHRVAGYATVEPGSPATLLDCPPLGPLDACPIEGVRFVVACGSNTQRRAISDSLAARGAEFAAVIHPAAVVSPSATIAPGAMVLASAILGPRARIEAGAIVNHAAVVDHDCVVEAFANICPGVRLAGCVQVREDAFVGLSASVIQGLEIGRGAVVGAGAVVIRDVAAGATVVGVPAREVHTT